MYLSRLFTLFSMYTKRNILAYSTISTDMYLVDPIIKRMRTERIYDADNNVFLYSHLKDYEYDTEINETQKMFITNKLDWYLENRNTYNVRYIPFYITKIKNQKSVKLENVVNNTNIVKIEESNISIKINEWDKLFLNKDINMIKETIGEIYIVPSNSYHVVNVKYKKEIIPSKINIIDNEYNLACESSISISIPEHSLFTIIASTPYYLNYDVNHWYWFANEEMNKILEPCVNLLELPITVMDQNLCKVTIPVNEMYLNKILAFHCLSLKYLNDYENDKLKNLITKQECIDFIKNELKYM